MYHRVTNVIFYANFNLLDFVAIQVDIASASVGKSTTLSGKERVFTCNYNTSCATSNNTKVLDCESEFSNWFGLRGVWSD